jgi:poly(A) polymerase
MQEIWLLQSRFAQRQRKRVFRLLAHPRFRAAFDFLVLRTHASDEHAGDVDFWRDVQSQPGEVVAAQLEAQAIEAGEGDAPQRRRRRRRRRPDGSAPVTVE